MLLSIPGPHGAAPPVPPFRASMTIWWRNVHDWVIVGRDEIADSMSESGNSSRGVWSLTCRTQILRIDQTGVILSTGSVRRSRLRWVLWPVRMRSMLSLVGLPP
jgi:hypothetical protein